MKASVGIPPLKDYRVPALFELSSVKVGVEYSSIVLGALFGDNFAGVPTLLFDVDIREWRNPDNVWTLIKHQILTFRTVVQ